MSVGEAKLRLDAEIQAARERYARRVIAAEVSASKRDQVAGNRHHDRWLQAAGLRRSGLTYAQIGSRLGVSTKRARDLATKGDMIADLNERGGDLSIRAFNVIVWNMAGSIRSGPLVEADAKSFAERMTFARLLDVPNCGERTRSEILRWLASYGLELRP